MKDLVERVASAISDNSAQYEETFEGAARAAIRAVLEHFSKAGNVTDEMQKALVNCPNVRGWKPSIAAMFRAALSELQAQGAGE